MRMLITALLLGLSAGAQASPDREINRSWSQDGLASIEIDANVGSVEVIGGDYDEISLVLVIEPDDDWGRDSERVAELIAAAELEEDRRGDTLALDLRTRRGRSGDNDIEEHWKLKLPSAMAAMVELNVGEVDITGVGGGVEAEVNVGELDIEVPGGDIEAEVNVGDLEIRSGSDSPGSFDLEVNIGDVDLEINGDDVGDKRGWLGGSIRHDAGGDDDVSAEVNIGNLDVDIDN